MTSPATHPVAVRAVTVEDQTALPGVERVTVGKAEAVLNAGSSVALPLTAVQEIATLKMTVPVVELLENRILASMEKPESQSVGSSIVVWAEDPSANPRTPWLTFVPVIQAGVAAELEGKLQPEYAVGPEATHKPAGI